MKNLFIFLIAIIFTNYSNQSYSQTYGFNGEVHSIFINVSEIYVGGFFTEANNSITAYGVAKWNGNFWSPLKGVTGLNNKIYSVAVNGTDIYLGGNYIEVGSVSDAGIAKWNGSSWSTPKNLVKSPPYHVEVITVSGKDVYIGGNFYRSGDISANGVAKWDGNAWTSLGSGVDNQVKAIAVNGTNVYVGGNFFNAGGIPVNNIAKWNGSSWSALGSGIGNINDGGSVSAIATNGNDVYAGGSFLRVGGNPIYGIAKWNGTTWEKLGTGLGGDLGFLGVYAIAINGSDVYVGGRFTQAGGKPANNIAKWNGTSWSPLGSGVEGIDCRVYAIAINGSDIIVGGKFTQAGGVPVNHIAKWVNQTWQPITKTVNVNDKYVPKDFRVSQNYPNPFNPETKIEYSIPEKANVVVKIYDICGKEIETLVQGTRPAGKYIVNWNPKGLSSGVYYYKLQAGQYMETRKMLYIR